MINKLEPDRVLPFFNLFVFTYPFVSYLSTYVSPQLPYFLLIFFVITSLFSTFKKVAAPSSSFKLSIRVITLFAFLLFSLISALIGPAGSGSEKYLLSFVFCFLLTIINWSSSVNSSLILFDLIVYSLPIVLMLFLSSMSNIVRFFDTSSLHEYINLGQAAGFFAGLTLIILISRPIPSLASLFLLSIASLILLLSGSRGPMLSIIFCLLISLSSKKRFLSYLSRMPSFLSRPKVILPLLIVLTLTTLFFTHSGLQLLSDIFTASSNRFLVLFEGSSSLSSSSFAARLDHYKQISGYLDSTGFLGGGFLGYSFHINNGQDLSVYPHNVYIQVFGDIGLLGFSSLLALLLSTLLSLYQKFPQLFLVLLYTCVCGLFSWSIYSYYPFFILLGLSFSCLDPINKKSLPSHLP